MSQLLIKICSHQATYDASVQGPAMPYASGEWTEYPQPPPEQYAGPWQPEQYPGYMEHYPTAAVSFFFLSYFTSLLMFNLLCLLRL